MSERTDMYVAYLRTLCIFTVFIILEVIFFPRQKWILREMVEHLFYFLFFGMCYMLQYLMFSYRPYKKFRTYKKTTVIENDEELFKMLNILLNQLGIDIELGD